MISSRLLTTGRLRPSGSSSDRARLTEPPRRDPAAGEDLTELLARASTGSTAARADLLAGVYHELHRLAAARMRGERIDHTLQPTALVHEAYLQLLGDDGGHWDNRAHFFGAAAEAMRRILVDYARGRAALKRGGRQKRIDFDDSLAACEDPCAELLAIDEALSKLARLEPQKARVVELRYFAGLGVEETAALLDVSPRTVKRDWSFAKAWLYRELSE